MSGHFSLETVQNWYRPIDDDSSLTFADLIPTVDEDDYKIFHYDSAILPCSVEQLLGAEETADAIHITAKDSFLNLEMNLNVPKGCIVGWCVGTTNIPQGLLIEIHVAKRLADLGCAIFSLTT